METKFERLETLDRIQVVFDRLAYTKIMHFVLKAPGEVSGLGKVMRQEDGTFLVKEVMMLPQKNTPGSTDIEPEDVARAMYELRNTPGELNFWWHSHVNMAAFWSGTDVDTIAKIGRAGYVVASVFNKKYEQKNAFYCNAPYGESTLKVFMDDIPHRIVTYLPENTFAEWDTEYDKNVKKNEPPMLSAGRGFLGREEEWQSDQWFCWREPKNPTLFDKERGFLYSMDKNDLFWKVLIDKDGKRIGRTPGYPDVLSDEEKHEQEMLLTILKEDGKDQNRDVQQYYN